MSGTGTIDSAESLREFGKSWWLLAVFGVITVGFGIVMTIKPGKAVHTIAIIFGIWLLILGAFRLVQAVAAGTDRVMLLIAGLLSILIALILLHHTTTTVAVLGFIIGIFWTIGGLAQLLHGFTANNGKVSWPHVAMGVVSTIVGVLCLVYPSLSLSILCVISGLGLIVYGLVEVLASFEMRKLKEA